MTLLPALCYKGLVLGDTMGASPNDMRSAQASGGSGATTENSLHTLTLKVERKNFTFDLRENPRGQFVRITEEVNGRYDAIIVPTSGLEQFRDALSELVRVVKSRAHPG